MKLKVYTKDGSNFTEQEFENIPQFEGDKGLFALKETLVAYQANARQGNASTLDYGHVSGTCRKPFKQKGTGRARAGMTSSPLWRGSLSLTRFRGTRKARVSNAACGKRRRRWTSCCGRRRPET